MPKQIRRALVVCLAAAGLAALAPSSAFAQTARLGIDISDNPDPVTVDRALAYTITVANSGPDPATATRVVNKLPARVTFTSAIPSQGSCERPATRRIVCALDVVESGASATIVIRVTPRNDGSIRDTATVTSREDDPVPANNSETERTLVVSPVIVNCAGRQANIIGTEGNDELTGTDGADVIAGLGGDDTVQSLGGDDVICASGGNDAVKAGNGSDSVRGGGGDDRLRGGTGGDNLRGKGGADNLGGGPGGDVLRGGGGPDVCHGGPGSDIKKRC